MIRVVLVEDQVTWYGMVRWYFERDGDIQVVAQVPDGRTALEVVPAHRPDVVVLDVMLPDIGGLEVTRRLRATWPGCRVVAWTGGRNPRVARDLKAAGACAFVRKAVPEDNIHDAIRAAARGETYFAPDLLTDPGQPGDGPEPRADPSALTLQELEMLAHLGAGKSMKEVAFIIGMSVDMVEYLRKRIFAKLGVHTLPDLVKYAIQLGLTPLS